MDIQQFTQRFATYEPKSILPQKQFAVLALLTQQNGELCFVLNKRAQQVHQPGDICFPGGHQEPNESLQETALRETEEELGIPKQQIQLLGASDYMLTAYGAKIQPYIGVISFEQYQHIQPCVKEVAEVFTVPISFFIETKPEIYDMYWRADNTTPFPYERIEQGKNYPFRSYRVPELFYQYQNYTIWGLTAQIIQNILATL